MADLFISYSRHDRSEAEQIAAALEADGYSVWWDRSLSGGENFSSRIENELNAAGAVIVLWSENAKVSDWVRDEANNAKSHGKLIPVSIDGSAPPLGFQGLHTIDLPITGAGLEKTCLSELARAIGTMLGGEEKTRSENKVLEQDIRFCKARDGVSIAYATVGEGPPLVKTANWMNHLEFDWHGEVWRFLFESLAANHTLVRYDERGNGLSDWEVEDFSIEALVADLEAVVDALGLKKFPLFGISQGCAVSIEYAARHPEKVTKLILYGGFARGWRSETETVIERIEAMVALMRSGWGSDNPAFRQLFTSIFMPDATKPYQDWFNEMQRKTTNGKNAAAMMNAFGEFDVTDRLADIKMPTLVLHARDELTIPYKRAREIASGIGGARLVTLDDRNHVPMMGRPASNRMLEEIRAFLAD